MIASRGGLQQVMRGVVTTEGPTYQPDGRLEVVRAVKLSKILEVVQDSYRQSRGKDLKISHDLLQREEISTIDAMGSAAIPGSEGHDKIKAKRAAEMDAYRRLAERALGVQVTVDTQVRNFVVSSDQIRAQLAIMVKSAEQTRIVFLPDQSAEVSMRMPIGSLVRTIREKVEADGRKTLLSSTTSQPTIEEVGHGVSKADESHTTEIGGMATPATVTTVEVESVIDNLLKGN